MKEDLTKQDKALDELLKSAEPPKAPDWFEARTLARLRRERIEAPSFSFRILRYLGAGVTLALLAFGLMELKWQADSAKPALAVIQVQDDQLFSALDAFDSYTQQAKEWNQEPY